MSRFIVLLFSLLLTPVSTSAGGTPAVAVVELFTSQGCYSCPPADALLKDLIRDRPDIVALEFHVDYWDTLVYGRAGKWRDPYSSADFSHRQRRYNASGVGGRPGVYTPQMLVNGRYALVGSDRDRLLRGIGDLPPPPLAVGLKQHSLGWLVEVSGSANEPVKLWLARFLKQVRTQVEGGENKGKYLENHHVVTALEPLGEWAGQPLTLSLPETEASSNAGCAVIAQTTDDRVLGAAYCPGS